MEEPWLRTPIGRDGKKWVTVDTQRTVLAVAHTVASMGHVLDAIELLEPDQRLQIVFAQAPDLFHHGVRDRLRRLGALVAGWHQATQTDFDLIVAGDRAGVPELHGPLLAVGHGVPNNKLAPPAWGAARGGLAVGLSAPWLTWHGRLIPAAIALPHRDLLAVLARECPPAVPVAAITGDLCLDRLVASAPHRPRYRRALGVDDDRTVVAISSTWGPNSLLATSWDALCGLMRGLPRDRFHAAVVVHPAAWHTHGPRQMARWLRAPSGTGLSVVDPVTWRGLVAAADVVVGDHGSAPLYAAAAGVPVLRVAGWSSEIVPGSAAERIATVTPTVHPNSPLAAQLRRAVDAAPDAHGLAARAVTSAPGRAAALLRKRMYDLLRLPEPPYAAVATPVDPPEVVEVGKESVPWPAG